MLGKIKHDKLSSIVDPLSAINNVFSTGQDGAHVVYEFEDDHIGIGAKKDTSTFCIYKLDVEGVIEDYNKPDGEIAIGDIADFINKLSLFDDDFDLTYDENRIVATNDNDSMEMYLWDPSEVTKGKRKFKSNLLEVGGKLALQSSVVSKLKKAIRSYVGQDYMVFSGDSEKGELSVSIVGEVKNSDTYKTVISDVQIDSDFTFQFTKDEMNKVLSCTNEFDVTFYVNKKDLVEFSYEKDGYSMRFFFSPVELD